MKPGLSRALILVAASLAGVVVAEIGLRVAGVSYPAFYRADPTRGFALRPGAAGLYRAEGRAWVQINADGLRDRERAREKPPGTYRIALLGDSYTEARQVPLEDTFGAEIERRLADCPALAGRAVEALNFGVSGYGTTQELLTLEHHAAAYAPDLVVLTVVPGNDLRDNSARLSPTHNRPFHVLRSGLPTLDTSFLESADYRRKASAAWRVGLALVDRLRVLQLLNEAQNGRASRRQAGSRRAAAASAGPGELGLDGFVYRDPADAAQSEAWSITEAVLSLVRDEAAAHAAGLLVVSATSGVQVDPDVESRADLARRLGVDDLYYAERRLQRFAEGVGIDFLALAPAMAAAAAGEGTFFHGFDARLGSGHWNAAGHRFAGAAIARRICEGLGASTGALRAAGEPHR